VSRGIAGRQGLNQRPLFCRRLFRQRQRFLGQGVGARPVRRIHRGIDVGAEHEGGAPVRHSCIWIMPGGLLVGDFGVGMIEAVGQDQPLVEKILSRLAVGCNRKLEIDEAVEKGDAP
jgi:hypothetical protein